MTSSTPVPGQSPALRLRGPGDLVVAVPYLLGFQPRHSLVLVAVDDRRRVALAARVDLPGADPTGSAGRDGQPPDAGAGLTGPLAARVGRRLVPVALRAGAGQVLAVLYPATTSDQASLLHRWRPFAAELGEALDPVDLLDCLLVHERRWWSLACTSPPCCPPQGRALPAVGTTVVEASAVLAGLAALPDRAGVAAVLAAAPAQLREPVAAALAAGPAAPDGSGAASGHDAPEGPLAAMRKVDQALARRRAEPGSCVSAAQAAALLRAVSDTAVRDAVICCSTPAGAGAAVSLWTELVRLAPDGWRAGPAALLAAAAYQGGSGVLAAAAAAAALEEDPGHVLAAQLASALDAGLSPTELEGVFRLGACAARASIEAMA